jgi:hypothetical protein
LLQSLIDFFKGIRKQDTEKSPAEPAPRDEPVKKEPAQAAPAQPPARTQQQPPQTAQAQPRQQPEAQQPQITAARTPIVPPDGPAENKPKRNLLQSLIDFFKGMRKQDTEKSPAEPAPRDEPIKKEPAQAAPAQPPARTQQQPPQTAQAQPRQQPAARTPDQAKPGTTEKGGKFPLWILLALVFLPAIAVIVFLFFLIRRKLETIPVRSVSYVAGRTVASPPRRNVAVKLGANPMVYLEVDDQNRNIGRRNTHSLKDGSTYTVGGGKSDFLIFLVPLPPSIGILKFDGKECTFIPKKPRYFPEISGEPVPDCIEKTIRVISDSGYKLSFRFRQYEDPLIALNRTMNSAGAGLS